MLAIMWSSSLALGGLAFLVGLLAKIRSLRHQLAALQHAEREKEVILTGIRDVGIEFIDTEMRLVWANAQSMERTGNTIADIDGRPCFEIRRGRKSPCEDCRAQQVLATGEYHESEIEAFGRTCFLQNNPVRDDDGNLIGVLNLYSDITARNKALEALRRSEEKYRTLVETINEALFEVDADGRVTYISAGIEKILGYRPETIIGRGFVEFIHAADRERMTTRFRELATGITGSSEYRAIDKDGSPHWIETFSQPQFKGGRFAGLVGVLTDIHQRKALEREAQRHKRLMEATLNATADGIVAADPAGRVLTWNRPFEEMWALPGDRMRGLASLQDLQHALADALVDGPPDHGVVLFPTGSGQTKREISLKGGRVFEVVSGVLSGDGSDDGTVWNFRDVTAAKHTEAALVRSETKFSTLFHASPIWSELVTLEEGRFIEVNQAFLDITGFERDDVIGTTSIELGLWPDDLDRASIVAHFEHHRRLDVLPCRFRMSDGRIRHFLWSAEAVAIDGKRCLISCLLDVTAQHHMQRALQKSEERYRSLYNSIPVGLFRTTPEGRILSANPALVALFGYDSEEAFLAQSSTSLYARAETRRELIATLDREGSVVWDAVAFRRGDGSTFWAAMSASKAVDGKGRFLHLDGVLQDVTERVMAERALRESEGKYRLLVENAYDGIFITRDGLVRFSNASTCRIFGYSREDITTLPLETFIHPEDAGVVMARHQKRQVGGNPPSHYIFRALRKSGEVLYLEIQTARVDWEGQPSILCVVRDITARHIAENNLKEEKRFSEMVINSLPGVFYLYDEGGRLRRWNHNMEALSGLSRGQLEGMHFLDWFDSRDQPRATEVFAAVLEAGKGQIELPVRTPSGRQRPYYFNGLKLDIEGRAYLLGVGLDISRQKDLEAALRESEARFRNLVEEMPFGICIAVDERIIYRNPAQERVLGQLDQSRALEDAPLPPEDLERYLAACRFVQAHAQPVENLELRFGDRRSPHPQAYTWMHCSIHPIDYRGRPAILIAMVDLTRIKELEQQMLIREKMASLGHVAAGIAHEIRNPLSGINFLLEGIRENYEDPDSAEDIRALLDETQKASDKIARVIRRVLDFAKPSAVKMTFVSVHKPVEEATQLTEVVLRKNGIALEKRVSPNLPKLHMDPQLIEQVLLNLINNAVAALKDREGERRILITYRRESNHLSVCVGDSGAGIPEALEEKIFDPYFTTRSDGSGIGLSLCQRIASDHGGTIEVHRCEELGGAEFRLRLPIEKRKHPR